MFLDTGPMKKLKCRGEVTLAGTHSQVAACATAAGQGSLSQLIVSKTVVLRMMLLQTGTGLFLKCFIKI